MQTNSLYTIKQMKQEGIPGGKCEMKTKSWKFFIIKRLFDYTCIYEMYDSLLLRWKS